MPRCPPYKLQTDSPRELLFDCKVVLQNVRVLPDWGRSSAELSQIARDRNRRVNWISVDATKGSAKSLADWATGSERKTVEPLGCLGQQGPQCWRCPNTCRSLTDRRPPVATHVPKQIRRVGSSSSASNVVEDPPVVGGGSPYRSGIMELRRYNS